LVAKPGDSDYGVRWRKTESLPPNAAEKNLLDSLEATRHPSGELEN